MIRKVCVELDKDEDNHRRCDRLELQTQEYSVSLNHIPFSLFRFSSFSHLSFFPLRVERMGADTTYYMGALVLCTAKLPLRISVIMFSSPSKEVGGLGVGVNGVLSL